MTKRLISLAVSAVILALLESVQSEAARTAKPIELALFDDAISADLATPEVLTALEGALSNKKMPAAKRIQLVRIADDLLGLNLLELTRGDLRIDPVDAGIAQDEIDRLIARRKQARAEKDFAASDAIRDELAAKGVEVMDGDALGWEWKL